MTTHLADVNLRNSRMTSLHNIVAPQYIDYSAYVVDMVDNIASN